MGDPKKVDEVHETVQAMRANMGFDAYCILNNDGIVLRQEGMDYQSAIHHACLVLDLCAKSKNYVRDLFAPPDNEVESLRMKTKYHELICSQVGNYTLIAVQLNPETVEKRRLEAEAEAAGAAGG